ncbi:hypothetical protein PPL_00954 [Heterostelium album PN500]|uniref:Uncharacterized protein n=1 Tax=Heterostelium pallidum (strain ATCC 26659 / Pp 5 / PN500) TaxID=670386 RepID=D3AXP7_HETP5|nr:hypothetical protein PPL_00954 [Heterostelium album PN500]EFA85724.1 hypothetical protein PPL_00954 [Heterostelium album PN500]|eukprot:XP_020437830.1 hypothetical protein PPL_00954 [Heterostelium album PN500]
MYRNNFVILFGIILLSMYVCQSNGQGISFQGSSAGGKPGNVTRDTLKGLYTSAGTMNLRNKARYDWTWCRLHIRDEVTKYSGYADFHPRVDEFTTLRVPYLGYAALFNPGATIWLEFLSNVSTTNFIYNNVTNTYPCPADGATNPNPPPPEGVCNVTGTTEYTITQLVQSNFTTYGNMTLQPKRVAYIKPNGNLAAVPYMVNTFTVVATVDKGELINVEWDGDRDKSICKQCEYCIQNQCAVRRSTMKCDGDEYDINEVDTNQKGCTLKIFLAWKGTDSKNKPCISISKAPSNFSKYSFYSISQMGLGLVNDFLQRVVGNTNNPNTA